MLSISKKDGTYVFSHNFSIIVTCPERDSNLGSMTLCYLNLFAAAHKPTQPPRPVQIRFLIQLGSELKTSLVFKWLKWIVA